MTSAMPDPAYLSDAAPLSLADQSAEISAAVIARLRAEGKPVPDVDYPADVDPAYQSP